MQSWHVGQYSHSIYSSSSISCPDMPPWLASLSYSKTPPTQMPGNHQDQEFEFLKKNSQKMLVLLVTWDHISSPPSVVEEKGI